MPIRPPPAQLAHWQRLLGEAHYGLGQMAQSRHHFEQALALLGFKVPTTTFALLRRLTKQLVYHLSLWIWEPAPVSDAERADLLEALNSYRDLGLILYTTSENLPLLVMTLHGFNLALKAGPSPELSGLYLAVMIIYRQAGLHAWAEICYQRAYNMALKYPSALAWVLAGDSCFSIGYRSWAEIEKGLSEAIVLFKRLGNKRLWGDSLAILGTLLYHQGQFATGIKFYLELYTLSVQSDNLEHQAWALTGQASCCLRLGQLEESLSLLAHSSSLWNPVVQTHHIAITNLAMMGLVYWYQGLQCAAQKNAETALMMIRQISPLTVTLFDAYAGVAEVYLALWEEAILSGSDKQAKELKSKAHQACQALRKFASTFPIGQPRAWLYRGVSHWLQGQRWRARRAWRKSLEHADKLEMPYEKALAHYDIGRLLPVNDPKRQEHLSQAVDMFTQLDAAYDLQRAQEALNNE